MADWLSTRTWWYYTSSIRQYNKEFFIRRVEDPIKFFFFFRHCKTSLRWMLWLRCTLLLLIHFTRTHLCTHHVINTGDELLYFHLSSINCIQAQCSSVNRISSSFHSSLWTTCGDCIVCAGLMCRYWIELGVGRITTSLHVCVLATHTCSLAREQKKSQSSRSIGQYSQDSM